MSPLLFMAAGGAQAYANAKNMETERQNKVGFAVIQADMENQYRERLAERQHQYDTARDQMRQQEARNTLGIKHGYDQELERQRAESKALLEDKKTKSQLSIASMNQDRADARTRANIAGKKEIALLNNSNKSSGSSGQFSVKDLIKANDNDEKEMHKIRMQLNDPLIMQKDQMTKGAKTSDILKQRLDELQMKVLDRQRMIDANGSSSGDDAGFAELANILKQ